jgi:hypothetical protein
MSQIIAQAAGRRDRARIAASRGQFGAGSRVWMNDGMHEVMVLSVSDK